MTPRSGRPRRRAIAHDERTSVVQTGPKTQSGGFQSGRFERPVPRRGSRRLVRSPLIPPTTSGIATRAASREAASPAARTGGRLPASDRARVIGHRPISVPADVSGCLFHHRAADCSRARTSAGSAQPLAFGHGRLRPHRREPPRPAGRPGVRRGRDPAQHPRSWDEDGGFPRELFGEDGRAGLPRGADPGALRRRRHGLHQLRDPVRGARAGRHRVPGRPERPRRAELARAAPVGDRGAAPALARAPGPGREARDVRPDRAGRRDRRRRTSRRRRGATAAPTASTARRSGSRSPTSRTTSSCSPRSTGRRSTRA